jgi:hypothetical protein
MKGVVIILLLAGFVYLLHYINPTFEEHKAAISTQIAADSPLWDKLNYKDYVVVSFTSGTEKSSMVTFGLCKFVKLVDKEWAEKKTNPGLLAAAS